MITVAALYVDPRGTLASRFWEKVNKSGRVVRPELGRCWEWIASTDRKGYGQIMCATATGSKAPQRAHRISWMLHHVELPELCVLHRCDNRLCVRPDHLFLGTVGDNNRDMYAKGRGCVHGFTTESRIAASAKLPRGDSHYSRTNPERLARGERHGLTQLTEEQVKSIRVKRKAGARLRDLAVAYGISEPAVSAIATRRNWRHVP